MKSFFTFNLSVNPGEKPADGSFEVTTAVVLSVLWLATTTNHVAKRTLQQGRVLNSCLSSSPLSKIHIYRSSSLLHVSTCLPNVLITDYTLRTKFYIPQHEIMLHPVICTTQRIISSPLPYLKV